jgi:hypothetical protein
LKSRLLAVKAGSLPLEPGLQPAASRFLKLLNEVGEAPPPLMPLPMMGALIPVLFFSRRWTSSKLGVWHPNSAESHNAEEREVN